MYQTNTPGHTIPFLWLFTLWILHYATLSAVSVDLRWMPGDRCSWYDVKAYLETQHIDNPESVTELRCQHCFLRHFPLWILDKMPQVTVLLLNDNAIQQLPDNIDTLQKLETLDLSRNQLTTLPHRFGYLQALHSFNGAFNQLHTLPDSFWQLHHLTSLSLYSNHLHIMPSRIKRLSHLKKLFWGHNALESIPQSIGQLTQLEHLYLNENALTHLPQEVGNLQHLQHLFLKDNAFHHLPHSVTKLATSLLSLDLQNNPDLSDDNKEDSVGFQGLQDVFGDKLHFSREEPLWAA